MSTVANVSVGKPNANGAVFVAPVGTTLPTDASTTPAAAFKELGFVSEDGVVNNNSVESDSIKSWGGQTVLTPATEFTDEFTMTLIESLNTDVLNTVYGSTNVTATSSTISINVNAKERVALSFVIDVAMTAGAMKRIVIPSGQISEIGEITYKDDEPIGYEITISALPDSSGNNHYEYIKLATT